MKKFTRVSGIVAPLLIDNIDTDVIIPVPWMKTYGANLGEGLFGRWRYEKGDINDTAENDDFILNKPGYRNATFLIAGRNFGCGSSREQAVWALAEFGIRCVIAPSFGDIFYNNCSKNGLLPLQLPANVIDVIADFAQKSGGKVEMTIDLENCELILPESESIKFSIPAALRETLINGRDFIDKTLMFAQNITEFQSRDRSNRPWIYNITKG